MVDNEVRYALPRVWVQFMGLPSYLRDYLIIWVVGSILGISKEVDMVFTRRFDICRFQVLVMNPNLIPAAVNVVIEDNLYELKFRVELNSNDSSLQLMDMDRRPEDGGADSRDEAETGARSNGWGLAPKSSQAGQGGIVVGIQACRAMEHPGLCQHFPFICLWRVEMVVQLQSWVLQRCMVRKVQ
jgi:hypothetical protein